MQELVNGVDLDVFRPIAQERARQQIGLPCHIPVALFVGVLDTAHRFKNVDGLLRAFASPDLTEAALVIVGDGNLRASLEDLAVRLGLRSRVHFVGSRSPDRLPPFSSAADVLVLPSTGVESFGLVLLESMACGTPPIATHLPGIAALIENEVDGLLVSPGDRGALARAIKSLLVESDHAAAMGKRGREKVIEEYGWPTIGRRLDEIYGAAVKA